MKFVYPKLLQHGQQARQFAQKTDQYLMQQTAVVVWPPYALFAVV